MDTEIGLSLEDASIAARPAGAGKLGLALTAAACFVAVAALAYAAIALLPLPGYGTWTGIRPLENKLASLERFCAEGPVDALALGSSIVDFGFSAQTFSQLMSQRLGHEYRVFNFATGGAEPRTLATLYRFARTACRPRAIFVIAPAEQRLREEISAGSPDHALLTAPVGPALASQRLLAFDKALWALPILKYAPAARDLFLFGGYRNLRAGMDSYEVNGNGDRTSFLMTWKPNDLPVQKKVNELYVKPYSGADGGALAHFFARRDIEAMRELRSLAREDGAKLYLFSHAGAATFFGGVGDNAAYKEGRREFYDAFADALGATLVDVDDRVRIPRHAISDTTHLNVYGARIYTRAAFDAFVGSPEDARAAAATVAMQPPPADLFPTLDRSFNAYAALLRRPANEADPLLRFRMVDSSDVPPLPQDQLYAALRMPDGKDIVVPAVPIASHEFVAAVNLPPSDRAQGIVLRLLYDEGAEKVAAMNTLADYEWVHAYPKRSRAPIVAWPPAARPGDSLYVGVRGDVAVPPRVAFSLRSREGSASLDLGTGALAPDRLTALAIPAGAAPGAYVLAMRDASSGEALAPTAAVELTTSGMSHAPAVVALDGPADVSAGHVRVRWNAIYRPRKHDWIGLFPVGSGPGGRLDLVFTHASASGEADFPIAASVLPRLVSGEFEFRLYAAGGWQMLAHSEPFTFVVPDSLKAAAGIGGPIVDPAPDAAKPRVFSEKAPRLALGVARVGWAGIAAPNAQDWVGLFPVGGGDTTRLDFVFTGGAREGEVEFPLAPALESRLASGEYEFRLYAAGGWTLLAKSAPLRFATGK